jgi:acetyl-CoA acetyltransferase
MWSEASVRGYGNTTGAAVVGVGRTPIYRRGQSAPLSELELGCQALNAACSDAGLAVTDIDGFVYYGIQQDTSLVAQVLGIPEVRFTVGLTGGGGGTGGAFAVAAAAVSAGLANNVVIWRTVQQTRRRWGAAFSPSQAGAAKATPERDFYLTAGLVGPGQMFAPMARRHMHVYGTTREHFAEVAIAFRNHVQTREGAIRPRMLTLDEYMGSPFLTDPFTRHDFCVESDLAGAVIVTSTERAADLRQDPVQVLGAEFGGSGRWGQAESWLNMPDDIFATSGQSSIAERLYGRTGLAPADVDAAMIYDNFTSNVLVQLEDYGFCARGEGGPFVASGAIRHGTGSLPVNTHGGQLAEAFLAGLTGAIEAVEQLRGTAVNQVEGAEVVLVTGGTAAIPVSAALLGR